eukprot:5646833-Amphidinium_carterae.1
MSSTSNTFQDIGSLLPVWFPVGDGDDTLGTGLACTLEQPDVLDSPSFGNRCTGRGAPVYSQKPPLVEEKAPDEDPLPDPSCDSSGPTTHHKGWAGHLVH